ncbi:Hexon protein [Dissostichus eleginoides]|uniref:Hexon protein n=1 Tax=Dissostichus eleginoides TaxID=100907 RepID=A0AAD9CNS4_DISEL|nr:Hexon protein [Dissostichus eleginoides]
MFHTNHYFLIEFFQGKLHIPYIFVRNIDGQTKPMVSQLVKLSSRQQHMKLQMNMTQSSSASSRTSPQRTTLLADCFGQEARPSATKHGGSTFLVPLHHHRGFRRNARRKKSDMARVVVEGMPETTAGGGGMLNRRKSKARRRKRKELFAIQMCFAGVMLGLVVGLKSVAQKAVSNSKNPIALSQGIRIEVSDLY